MDQNSKACSKCAEVKILEDFVKNRKMKNGYSNTCKECKNKHNKVYYTNVVKKSREDNPIDQMRKEFNELKLSATPENCEEICKKMTELSVQINAISYPDTSEISENPAEIPTENSDFGILYLLREREFVRMNEETYKVGRTTNFANRMGQYPKGSEIIFVVRTPNHTEKEKELLQIFREKFRQIKDYGSEYFNGDVSEMQRVIYQHLDKNNENIDDLPTENINVNITVQISGNLQKT